MTPTLVRFAITSSRLIRCGMAACWSIRRVISLLIARGASRFVQPGALLMIFMRIISAEKNRVPEVSHFTEVNFAMFC